MEKRILNNVYYRYFTVQTVVAGKVPATNGVPLALIVPLMVTFILAAVKANDAVFVTDENVIG